MIDVNLPLEINTIDDAATLLSEMIRVLGDGFHPDTPAHQYQNGAPQAPMFTIDQQVLIDRLLGEAQCVEGVDVYALSMEILREQGLREHPIVRDVKQALQRAEELGGPEGQAYVNVMLDVEAEARNRRMDYLKSLPGDHPDALAIDGIWTPDAMVICLPCHGQRFFSKVMPIDEFEERCKLRQRRPSEPRLADEGRTICHVCKCPIWIRDDVAALSELLFAIGDEDELNLGAALQQTGGMCAALVMHAETGNYVATGMDEAAIDIGFYPGDTWETTGECPDDAIQSFEKVADAVAYLKTDQGRR